MNSYRRLTVLGIGVLVAGSAVVATSASAAPATGSAVSGRQTTQAVNGPVRESDLTTGQDVVRQTTSAVKLQSTGGVQTTVLSTSLPAGSWVLSSNASLVSWGPSDYTRCTLFVNETVVGGAATMVGAPSPNGEQTGVYVATVSAHGAFTSGATTTVSLRCSHDHTRAASETAYVDPSATLWAHRS
ncbi:hypothetical protein LX15_000128 [Streptoalloteichus tenebrarius]|uniref:Secreted protein n=1 Tax=Streptoalloteichus tenebrarius (strain ATCC 17920 / DSM 40477 / JCM 4838 / CBS 697.72 / NBRC 16177 / NCIMB 11028 / NRRL B-12390 / A12253. 1 / ISP 5477) TaxID=1933 RepID=A0ABT1HLR6_STRSD|nr:hypothetical protein [Streptoalloteichus tenebrarius]MCP2256445.1 hypothetical protein [Streptoalloteichus tenebrarius]BFF04796.1 hypothetical protein GCM10020241_64710 [Streptoalloteichus tenebrarius]